MADEKPIETPIAADAPPVAAATAPAAPATPPAAAAASPTETPPPPSEAKPEVKAEPERTPTLLEKFDTEKKAEADKKAEESAKPAEAKAPEAAKPAESKAEEKPAEAAKPEAETKPAEPAKPEPVEYKYTLPDTIKMDDALKGKVHTAFDNFRANPAEGVQQLIDLHNEQMTSYAQGLRKEQFDVFNKTKENWEKAWLADPEIGGAGHMTALGAIARTRDLGISSAAYGSKRYNADLAEFNEMLAVTGVGSHPAFGRLLHNLARYLDEPQAAEAPTEIKPPKNNGRGPRRSIYTHESSQNMDK